MEEEEEPPPPFSFSVITRPDRQQGNLENV